MKNVIIRVSATEKIVQFSPNGLWQNTVSRICNKPMHEVLNSVLFHTTPFIIKGQETKTVHV